MAYRGCDLILSCHEAETDHAKWLETRNAGIGGSDASVIMGLNPYKSPYQLWLEKRARRRRQTCQATNISIGGTKTKEILPTGSWKTPGRK